MSSKLAPLAPEIFPVLPAIPGVRLATMEAGIKYRGRTDLCLIAFDKPARIAGVFTRSKCPSAPVDWCREHLDGGLARAIVINSGNANAFTGKKGADAALLTARAAAVALGCKPEQVFLASTGVIGEPLDASGFGGKLEFLAGQLEADRWHEAAEAIMTTDTYPKLATRSFEVAGQSYTLNGIAKGSGMIAPDMATMLGFLVTDFPVSSALLQTMLSEANESTFNAVTVDSDTSTSDTVLLMSCGDGEEHSIVDDPAAAIFREALHGLMHELALHLVRDGEGATKQVGIEVTGATSVESAKIIARAIANSPLVKTAIAGEDANWGRIVMAVGKAGEPAERDRLEIRFGDVVVARDGERVPDYSEEAASAVMRLPEIEIAVDLGLGSGHAKVWTCDLTREYVAINGDYRS